MLTGESCAASIIANNKTEEQLYGILEDAVVNRDEFGPKFFGPGLKWAMKILAWPGHWPKSMLAFGPGRAWAKFKIDGPGWAGPKCEKVLKKLLFL